MTNKAKSALIQGDLWYWCKTTKFTRMAGNVVILFGIIMETTI